MAASRLLESCPETQLKQVVFGSASVNKDPEMAFQDFHDQNVFVSAAFQGDIYACECCTTDVSSPHIAIKVGLQCREVIFSGPETPLKQIIPEHGSVEVAGILL